MSEDPARTTAASVDEVDLLERLRAGQEGAFEELVRTYGGRMLAATRRILGSEEEAQDAVQEAFLSAFKALESFQGQSKIGTWIHRIAINAALMRVRKLGRSKESSIEELLPAFSDGGHFVESPVSWGEAVDAPLLREETQALVRAKIDELPDNYRIALLLRDIEGLSNEEVATSLGVSVNAAKIRVHRARQALKQLLDAYMNEVSA